MHKSTHKLEPLPKLDNFVIETLFYLVLHERAWPYKYQTPDDLSGEPSSHSQKPFNAEYYDAMGAPRTMKTSHN